MYYGTRTLHQELDLHSYRSWGGEVLKRIGEESQAVLKWEHGPPVREGGGAYSRWSVAIKGREMVAVGWGSYLQES